MESSLIYGEVFLRPVNFGGGACFGTMFFRICFCRWGSFVAGRRGPGFDWAMMVTSVKDQRVTGGI
jgi:hypothetical protein